MYCLRCYFKQVAYVHQTRLHMTLTRSLSDWMPSVSLAEDVRLHTKDL